MPIIAKYNPMLKRKQKFLFKENGIDTVRYDITKQSNSKVLGENLGIQILNSFKNNIPINGLYVFGRIGMGKTVLATAIINNFENTEDLLIDIKHDIQYRYYDTYPKCYHLDYYSYRHKDFQWKNKIKLNSDEIIIAEWSEYLPINFFEKDRIEIELYHCYNKNDVYEKIKTRVLDFSEITSEDSLRFASLIGYGNGIKIIENLKNIDNLNNFISD